MSTVVYIVLGVVALAALVYWVLLLAVSFVSVRPPRIPVFLSPGLLGDPQETVTFTTSDGIQLTGWWVQGRSETVIVCLHGFLSNRCELVPYGPRLRARGANLLFVDFRCHGSSQRTKCTFGIDEANDVRAAVDYARQRVPGAKIVLFGSSMGGASAVRAVADDPTLADAMILDGAYANLEEAAKGFWYVTGFKSVARMMAPAAQVGRVWLGRDPRSIDLRGHYSKLRSVPVLFLYGTTDEVVPVTSAKECVTSAEGRVEWFEGCGHAQGRFAEPERYFASILAFLDSERLLDPVPLDNKTQEPKIISSVSSV